jgi:hypothetical protein
MDLPGNERRNERKLLGGAKLLKLAVEGLAHGADAGITDQPFRGVSFDHNS